MMHCPACGFLHSLLESQCPACHLPRHAALAFSAAPPAPDAAPGSVWPGLGVWCLQALIAGIVKGLLLVIGLAVGVTLFIVTTIVSQLLSRRHGAGAGFGLPTELGPSTGLDAVLGHALSPSPLPLVRHLFGQLGRDIRS